MPVCRNCNSRISKFDKDICPVCGAVSPLKGVTSETIEVTSEIDINSKDFNFKPKDRNIVMLLFTLIGFTGIPFFYLKKNKLGLIWLISNIILISLIALLLIFAVQLDLIWGIIIPVIISYIINIGVGLFYLFKSDIKDGRGEFIR